ncbi:helix-turn-helix transcriptional regulator [uncultured Desulfovibrio sp.]|uniref:helix-turn-helix transcriptional regulator n=1 Tax=uncultured Desulfovibrio sp. TaxID=167968 RepID=UPI00262D45E9|nr:helix-turn-helix transcriptional regulator [uncultured Desulfovibrio sp.]
MKELRYILGAGCLNAWLWLAFRSYGDPEPFLFNDEFGRLFAVLPCAALFLLLIGLWRERLRAEGMLSRLWIAGCAGLCSPLLLSLNIPLLANAAAGTAVSALAGFGFAVGFVVLGMGVASLPRRGILVVVSSGIIVSRALIHGMLALRPEGLLLLPVVFALAAKLLLEPPAAAQPLRDGESRAPSGQDGAPEFAAVSALHDPAGLINLWLVYAVYSLTGFSHGLYYSLLAVMEPLLPRLKPHLLLIVVLSCLISPLCIHLARRAFIWRTVLLMGPLLVVGYTAWPLLHRESPALSLDSLHFACTLLGVYSYTTLFYAASWLNARRQGNGIRFIGMGEAILLFSLLLGTYALPGIRASLSHGTTVNYLFALLAVTILLSSSTYVFLLERMGFWEAAPHGRPVRPMPPLPDAFSPVTSLGPSAGNAAQAPQTQQEEGQTGAESLSREECVQLFRQCGLTRQQALIAAMLTQKHNDAAICASLNISPSTLKTHIRNILRRLNINSRHELPWLVCHAAGGQNEE